MTQEAGFARERSVNEYGLVFLVAEKDMSLRASLVEMLKGMGFSRVQSATTGAQAWSLLMSRGATFILSGWNLTDITGLDLLRIVRAQRQYRRIPFVLVTELPTKQQALDAGAAGVNDFMIRPLNATRVKERIDALLSQTFDQQQLQVMSLFQEGLAWFQQGAWEKALRAMNAVTELGNSAEALYHQGQILNHLRRPQEAVVCLARAVRMDPFFRRASQLLGETLLVLGRDKDALPHLERAVDIFMDQVKDPASPQSIFKEPWQPGSTYFSVFDSLGIIYRRLGLYAQAAALYAKALQINPRDGNIYHHIGRTHYEIGEYGEAKKALKKALELTPGMGEAQKLLKIVETKLATAK